jgi:hypothetical protein
MYVQAINNDIYLRPLWFAKEWCLSMHDEAKLTIKQTPRLTFDNCMTKAKRILCAAGFKATPISKMESMEFFPDSDGLFKAYSIGIRLLDKVPICPDNLCKSILPAGYSEYLPGIMEMEFSSEKVLDYIAKNTSVFPRLTGFLMLPPVGSQDLVVKYLRYLRIEHVMSNPVLTVNKVKLLRSKLNINKAYEEGLC